MADKQATAPQKTPDGVTVRQSVNGSYIVRHEYTGGVQPAEEHVFSTHPEMMEHLRTTFHDGPERTPSERPGSDDPQVQVENANWRRRHDRTEQALTGTMSRDIALPKDPPPTRQRGDRGNIVK